MTLGTLNANNVTNLAVVQPYVYFTNDFDAPQVWDGARAAVLPAGIDAPAVAPLAPAEASGNVTIGDHLIAYYYRDSTSPAGDIQGYGYRSNISPTLTHTVSSSAKKLTFTITDPAGGGKIIRSTDAKADRITVVMTTAGGTAFYVAADVAMTATSVDIDVSDAVLSVGTSLAAVGGEFGHEPPPLCGQIAMCRGYAFASVFYDAHVTISVTNGSATVTAAAGTFSTEWAGRLLTVDSAVISYRILSVASSSSLTLASVYAGTTNATASAVVQTTSPNRLYWSRQYYPESWRLASQAIDVLRDVNDRIVAVTEYLGDPWVIGKRTCQRLVFSNDPAAGDMVTVSGENGVWNARCVVKPDSDTLLAWGSNGVWIVAGGRPTQISGPIDDDWRAIINYSQTSLIHGWYAPETGEVKWAFAEGSSSLLTRVLVYDMAGRRWRIDKYRIGLDGSTVVDDANGRIRSCVSDATNDMTYYEGGKTDGVPTTLAGQGKLTVGTGGTTTTTPVAESLPTGAKGASLAGLSLYAPTLGETVIIASNTADTITHAAFSAALTNGLECFVGSIPVDVSIGWWAGQDQSIEKVPEKVLLYAIPSSAATVANVFLYRDFSASPFSRPAMAGRTYPKGVSRLASGTGLAVDLSVSDGYIEIPVGATAAKVFRVRITCDDPSGEFTILDVQWKSGDRAQGGDGE